MSNFRLTFSAVCAILPLSAQLLLWGFADAAYPREGTVTRPVLITFSNQMGCSLAPRGDGYAGSSSDFNARTDAAYPREGTVTSSASQMSWSRMMQLSPARGRLLGLGRLRPFAKDAAYPREGTVTTGTSQPFPPCRMQLSPARGRLLKCFAALLTLTIRCSLSPRGDSLHVFSPANFRHFIDNLHILCYTSW